MVAPDAGRLPTVRNIMNTPPTLDASKRIGAAARAVENAGVTHLFLGDPLSHGCDKTAVEPGNNFSPGLGTFGVSLWIDASDKLFTPDLMNPSEIDWRFDDKGGMAPIVKSTYAAGGTAQITHRIGHLGGEGSNGVDFVHIEIEPSDNDRILAAIVVKDVGPAGRKIERMDWDGGACALTVNSSAVIVFEQPPVEVDIAEPDEKFDSPLAIVTFEVTGPTEIAFKCVHGFANTTVYKRDPIASPPTNLSVAQGLSEVKGSWKRTLPARITCPDPRVVRAYECSAHHVLAAMECGLPRIGVLNYPIFWIRDCVIVLRALDLIGRHDLARVGCDYLAPMIFGGGFGAEADNPGEGIWALANHAQITSDDSWLRDIYPDILRRVDWIARMIDATAPISWVTENRTPAHMLSPDDMIVCRANNQGTIDGRMDLHLPAFFVNCWAICGLRRAAWAAARLGDTERASSIGARADELERNVARVLLPRYGNERDPIVTPHPTNALMQHTDDVRAHFSTWARDHMLGDGSYRPWPYFQVAHVHNAFLLGPPDLAWTALEPLIAEPPGNALHIFQEGFDHERLPYKNGDALRGWLSPERGGMGNMPHNWASGEMLLLMRDMFVREQDYDYLVLGEGVHPDWLQPGMAFGVSDMPTNLGPVSYHVETDGAGRRILTYDGPANPVYSFRVDEVRI